MKRKWIKILAAAMCIMMAVPMIASADPLVLDAECSLTVEPVKPAPGRNDDMVVDLNEVEIVYDLYKVAEMVDDGGYYTYQITDEFAGLLENESLKTKYNGLVDNKNQLLVPQDGSDANRKLWEDLAQEAAMLALDPVKAGAGEGADTEEGDSDIENAGFLTGSGLPVVGKIVGTEKPGTNAFTEELNKDNKVKVLKGIPMGEPKPELDTGLYLLIARGISAGDAYITRIKAEASETDSTTGTSVVEEKIVTVAYTDQHVYAFAPELVSLPTPKGEADANGMVSTANGGEWDYEPTVYLKPAQYDRYGYLEIVKDLLTYGSFSGQSEEAVFVFQVEAELNGQSVYSDVKTLIFTAAGETSVLIDKIPVGATVTVTEVYSGASYVLESVGQGYHAEGTGVSGYVAYADAGNAGNIQIEANRVASVKFTNDYDNRQTSGHGVVNHYEYGENGWADNAEQEFTNPNQAQNNSQQDDSNF